MEANEARYLRALPFFVLLLACVACEPTGLALTITTRKLPAGTVGVEYAETLRAVGGTGSYDRRRLASFPDALTSAENPWSKRSTPVSGAFSSEEPLQ